MINATVKADAKKYNKKYAWFEVIPYENTDITRTYKSYGNAYRYADKRVREGENLAIYGCKFNFDTCQVVRDQLIGC
jgi:hypothetical protein